VRGVPDFEFQISNFLRISTPPPYNTLPAPSTLSPRSLVMEISARNMLKGKVKWIVPGAVNSEITVELPGGQNIVSIITKASADRLHLEPGKAVYAVIKSSDVMIAVD